MTWWQGVIGLLGVTLVPLLTWLAARSSAKNGRQSNHTADWEAFSREQREWTEDRLAERDHKIGALAKEVAEIRAELDTLMSKYRIAIAYIRRVVRQLQEHVPPDDIEAPPDEIMPDL